MSIKYIDNSDIFIGRDENITDVRLNQSFNKMLDNDMALSPTNGVEPKIWECRWFSDENVRGYDKGYAVWINTEDEDEFLDSKADDIYEYIKIHPYFLDVKEYNKRDRESYEIYHSILTGYVNKNNGTRLQPIYFLGNLSSKTQIKISTKDNNKDTPDTLSSWRDYLIRDTSYLENELSNYGDYLFDKHNEEFHFGDVKIDTDDYANNTLKNVNGIDRYSSHIEGNSLTGFDYIQRQQNIKNTISVEIVETRTIYTYGYTLSSFEYVLNPNLVHRDRQTLKTMMEKTRNYERDKIELAIDSLDYSNDSYFVDVKFRMVSSNTQQESYPWVVTYDQWSSISDDSTISRYDTTFKVVSLPSTVRYDYQQNPEYYIQRKNTIYYTHPQEDPVPLKPKDNDYYLDGTLSSSEISVFRGAEYHNILKGYNCWKSGYLEQFGFVECVGGQNTYVKLPIKYEYEEETDSFYGFYTDIGDVKYNGKGNLGKKSRYSVQLTQMYNGYIEDDGTSEINTMTNEGFSIYNQSKTTRYYMYNVRGYISRSI